MVSSCNLLIKNLEKLKAYQRKVSRAAVEQRTQVMWNCPVQTRQPLQKPLNLNA